MLDTDQIVTTGTSGGPADRVSVDLSVDPAAGMSVLHVVVKAGPTNSQYNEHCLPVMGERRITVCSLYPADVEAPPGLVLVEGDGSVRGCVRALRTALAHTAYDVVHVHAAGSGLLTLAVYLATWRSRRNLVFTLHTSWPNVRPRNRLIMYVVAAFFPVVVACGEASAQSLPPLVRRLARALEVVPNGVDVDRVDRAVAGTPGWSARRHAGLVVTVGRLIPVKDPATVVAAFRRGARQADRLVMVGEGELPAATEDTGGRRGRSRVRLAGLLPRDRVYELLRRADVFVSASTVEGLPVSVLEAMACGCPVVLSDIPAHREIAALAPAVRLVPTGDVDGFAAAIRGALTMSAADHRQVGAELRGCAAEHYSVRRMNRAYGVLYARIAGERRGVRDRPRMDRGAIRQGPLRRVAYAGTCGLLGAAAAFSYGQWHPPTYQAGVTLAAGDISSALSTDDLEDRTGSTADVAGLVDRQPVMGPVARTLGLDDWRSLRARVDAAVAPDDPLSVVVTASGDSRGTATRLATAVADRLVTLTRDPMAQVSDHAFTSAELDRYPQEIDTAQQRLDDLVARGPVAPRRQAAHDRAVADLREELAELQAGYRGLLELRSADDRTRGLTVSDRSPGRAAPPLPSPAVLALAGGAAGTCLWLGLGLLLRREPSVDPRRTT
jgi:glycosyltransferase involved in cell wall biosynthesis